MRPGAGDLSSFLFFEGASESGDAFDEAEAAARCMNFMVKSLDEIALGVSGAIM